MQDFARKATSLQEVFEFILKTVSGKQTLKLFYNEFNTARIQVIPFPTDLREKLLKVTEKNHPLGAFFITDGTLGTIFIDIESNLGILIPYLFHEIIHSLDQSLWNAAITPLTKPEKQKVLFEAECKAFDAQHQLLEELKTIYPEPREFHLKHFPHIPFLNRKLSPTEISNLYKSYLSAA